MKKWIIFLAGIVGITGIVWGYQQFSLQSEDAITDEINTVTLSAESYTKSIKVIGTAKLAHEQKLRFLQGGKVQKILVKPGDTVKKGDLLASLDMGEFNEIFIQSNDRLELTKSRLETARAKIGGLEGEKQRAELSSLESRKKVAEEDLQKLIKSAPQKSETKRLELDAKKTDLQNKETTYNIDNELYEKEVSNKNALINKKVAEGQKIIDSILQSGPGDYSDDISVRQGINKTFAFQFEGLLQDERTKAAYVGWNAGGLVAETRKSWQESGQFMSDIRNYLDSNDARVKSIENALRINDMLLGFEEKLLETVERAKKTLDSTQPYDSYMSSSDIESLKSTFNTYRSSLISCINTRKENKNNLPLVSSDTLIKAQVEKELTEKKQSLINAKIVIEKLRTEIIEAAPKKSIPRNTGSMIPNIDKSIQRDIDTKHQEILDLSVQISSKKIDIDKLSRGKTDEIVNLESELKTAQSEVKKALTRKSQYELRAPIDGMIRNVKMMEGDNLSSSSVGNDGTITIEDNNAVLIITKLGQKDIVRVKQGTEAQIRLDTFPDVVFTGSIVEMSSSPDEGGGGGESLYEIRILFDRGDKAVYSGMSANITINLESRENVLFIPLSAVRTDPITREKTIIVIGSNGKEEQRIVSVGVADSDRVEVLSGATSGENVKLMNFNPNDYKVNEQVGPMGI